MDTRTLGCRCLSSHLFKGSQDVFACTGISRKADQTRKNFAAFVAELSEDAWRKECPSEQRTVAALSRHIAQGYLWELRAFNGIAVSQERAVLTRDRLDRMNAEDGAEHATDDRDDVLKALDHNGKEASEFVRSLTDEQLQRVGAYVDWVPAMSVDQWIERVLIGHIQGHMASIQAVVE